jgi:hypothetical protein
MHIVIKFLFHNPNVTGIVCFVIFWCCQFDCDVVCNVRFEDAWTVCYTYFRFLKDTKPSWTNLGGKTVYFTVIVNSFKDWHAAFFTRWMIDHLTFLICIVMKYKIAKLTMCQTQPLPKHKIECSATWTPQQMRRLDQVPWTSKHHICRLVTPTVRPESWLGTRDHPSFVRPTQEFFTYMEMSPLPVKGCKI